MPESDALEFAKLAAALQAAPTPDATADEIVGYVRGQLDADYVGITLIGARQRLETIAETDPLVGQIDRLQQELGDGPCYDASWHRQTLISEDLAHDRRWPEWTAEVSTRGISSLLAAELTTIEDRRIGSINAYWSRIRSFAPDDAAFASIFARHATIALSQSWSEEGLNVALDSRKLIGQAQGILMERHGLDADRAFEVLRRYSQDHNIKLRHVAEHLVATRRLPQPGDEAVGL